MFFFPFFPFCSHFAKHVIKMQKYKPLFPLPKSESANLSYCCSRQSWDNQVFHSVALQPDAHMPASSISNKGEDSEEEPLWEFCHQESPSAMAGPQPMGALSQGNVQMARTAPVGCVPSSFSRTASCASHGWTSQHPLGAQACLQA